MLRDNKWRQIKGIDFPFMNTTRAIQVGSLLNDVFHWVAFSYAGNVNVTFYLVERIFQRYLCRLILSVTFIFVIGGVYRIS